MRISTLTTTILMSIGCLFWTACKTPNNTQGTDNTNTTIDSIPPMPTLTPDPFSGLVEMDTRYGTMKIELFFDTPNHRENFTKLIQENYYDSLLFHRVIRNFMIQGGDPDSRNADDKTQLGGGGPDYTLDAEFQEQYFHVKGALAAARQPDEVNPEKKSSGSQFYIVQGGSVNDEQLDRIEREYGIAYGYQNRKLYKELGGAPQLDMEYTIFGRVYEGLDIIDSIAAQPTTATGRPLDNEWMVLRLVQ